MPCLTGQSLGQVTLVNNPVPSILVVHIMSIDSPAQLAFQSAMWDDLREEPPPPLLAHYTSLSTLEKILRSKEFWLSNPLYMNDREELRFGMQEGALAVHMNDDLRRACGDQATFERLLEHFNALYGDYSLNQALDAYVLCFSAHEPANTDGVLSMWRGYGAEGSGAALLVDTSLFPRLEQFPLTFGKVQYATADERRTWLKDRIAALAKAIEQHERSEENLLAAVRLLIERIKIFSLFTKHSGFVEEQEWRAVYMRERDQRDLLVDSLSYAITDRGAEPKLRLRLDHFTGTGSGSGEHASLFAGVILGPSHFSELSRASVRRMLQVVGHPELANRLSVSTIPFRSPRGNLNGD